MPRINWALRNGRFAPPREKWMQRLLDDAVVLVDEREQEPWEFKHTRRVRLEVGDYSAVVAGEDLRRVFVVERKASPSEFLEMVGRERERWERELLALGGVPHAMVICEFSLQDLEQETLGRKIALAAVWGSLISWQVCYGVPILFAGSRETAAGAFWKALELVVRTQLF